MSKIAIISDIHGNMPALEAVLEDIQSRGISKIYCLGDLVGYYCFFNEVVERIIELNITCILGNHDDALINKDGIIGRSKTCTNILKWQLKKASPSTLNYLRNLPTSLNVTHENFKLRLVHAGLVDNIDEYLMDVSDEYLSQNQFFDNALISGHTHLASYKKLVSGISWFNPGSVGQPRDLNNKASYLILDSNLNPEFIRVSYDFHLVIDMMKKYQFDAYISEGLATGKKIH